MARYIDAEALVTRIIEDVITTTEEAEGNKDFFIDLINNPRFIPTADVAPKSEVASEIFMHVDCITRRYVNDRDYSMGEMLYDLDDLKKKYTEAPDA